MHTNEEGKVGNHQRKMVMIEVWREIPLLHMDQIDFFILKGLPKRNLYCSKKKPKQFLDTLPKRKSKLVEIKATTGVWLNFIPEIYG